VTEDPGNSAFEGVDCPIVDIDDYLTAEHYCKLKGAQVINLCHDYRYLSVGYYCSLLAEARNHRVIPSVKCMLDLSSKSMYSLDAVNLDETVQKAFKKYAENNSAELTDENAGQLFELKVFFGHCRYEELSSLARQIFETFAAPLLKVTFKRLDKWHITAIKPVAVRQLKGETRDEFTAALNHYLKKRWREPRSRTQARYDLAILHDPHDELPPSDKKALQLFIKAGRQMGVDVELIEKRDYSRLAEYDALFIRVTTRINHYTYRFAKKAESEGMVVMDDPTSILRCTNKVYLAELLRNNNIATPKTIIIGKNDLDAAERAINFPIVLKVPDGSFSNGVFKAENSEKFREIAERLFKSSELILAQEYLYTDFDWRIGVLNRKPFFASQYFMSKKHWQIVNYDAQGHAIEGDFKTYAVEDAPPEVVEMALRAANLIGDGLYGVDLKQTPNGVYVIEVNDNPSLEQGVEDQVIKEKLYQIVIGEFVRRLDLRHGYKAELEKNLQSNLQPA
jgi:glutathione synthase/RimK-type ligase-like ATP-grasp enzyme